MKFINKLALVLAVLSSLFVFTPSLANAIDAKCAVQKGVNGAAGAGDNCTAKPTSTLNDTIETVINVLSVLVGIIAVVMIIVGGFRYITSGGDSTRVASAKNTLLYAVIGLIIAVLAQVIVRFVLAKVT